MIIALERTTPSETSAWRDLYRHEMHCQVVCDSFHERTGWTEEYWLQIDDTRVGYGSLVVDGPWAGKPTLFEFYVLPPHRTRLFELFDALLRGTPAGSIYCQSNDPLLAPMLPVFGHSVVSEAILFRDGETTSLVLNGAAVRLATEADVGSSMPGREVSQGEWVVEVNGAVAGSGGILYHYNRPYGDIYMAIFEPYRRMGLGAFLVQELKRICYEGGSIPAARCNTENLASRMTLQRAGFVPCGHRLTAAIK